MNRTFRRIVTGVDVDGKSSVVDDSRIGEGDHGNFNLWITEVGGSDRGERLPFFPPPGGTIFRVVRLPPSDPAMHHRIRSGGVSSRLGWLSLKA